MSRNDLARGIAVLLLIACAGCAGTPCDRDLTDAPPLILTPIGQSNVIDGRGRFREIFEAVGRAHPAEEDECAEPLHALAHEPPPTGRPVHLGPPRLPLRILIVPGLLGDIAAPWAMPFENSLPALAKLGVRTDYIRVSGRASCEYNAELIKQAFAEIELAPGERVLLIGYSKGAPDGLTAIVDHPEVREKVAAFLSVTGAIGGSPVADDLPDLLAGVFGDMPWVIGTRGDGLAIESIRRPTRQLWLDRNRLPSSVRYFSLCAFAAREKISSPLLSGFDACAQVDPRNDGQLLLQDQIIPGATLLGICNADHWAICLPFVEEVPISGLFVDENDYPRTTLLEAAVRFVEEALLADGDAPVTRR